MNRYAGESVAKKVARIRVYRRAKRLMRAAGIDERSARYLALAGPEVNDVGCLRFIMRARPENVLFVDEDDTGLKVAPEKWPGVLTYHGVLDARAVEPFDRIDCAVVDVCGHFDRAAVSAALRRLPPGGVIAYTILRARESRRANRRLATGVSVVRELLSDIPSLADRVRGRDRTRSLVYLEMANDVLCGAHEVLYPPPTGAAWEARRLFADAVCAARRENLKDRCLVSAGWIEYWSGNSPMAVAVWQLSRPIAPRWRAELDRNGFRRGQTRRHQERVIVEDSRDAESSVGHARVELLRELDALRGSGLDERELAEVAAVSPRTLAAWRAHRTMGTYGSAA